MSYTKRFINNAKRLNADTILFVSCVGSIATQDFYVSSAIALSATLAYLVTASFRKGGK